MAHGSRGQILYLLCERGHHGRIHTANNMLQSHKDLLHLVGVLLRDPAFIISTPYNSLLFLMGIFVLFFSRKKHSRLKMNVAHCWRGLS